MNYKFSENSPYCEKDFWTEDDYINEWYALAGYDEDDHNEVNEFFHIELPW